jgi:RNA polymerase sigma-70 factor (ECF subfamily)
MPQEGTSSFGDITVVLQRLNTGNREAWHELTPLVYQHLRQVSAAYVSREQGLAGLQPTEIVHEAYLRLLRHQSIQWVDRNHFYGVAAYLIRLILVDKARAAARHAKVMAEEVTRIQCDSRAVDIEALDAALNRLAQLDPRQAHIVELRYFAGMTIEETAAVLSLSPRTIKREWTSARAWLRAELEQSGV